MNRMTAMTILALAGAAIPSAADVLLTNVTVTCAVHEPGTVFKYACWRPDGLKDGEGALYFFLEHGADAAIRALKPLMAEGAIPPGICVLTWPGRIPAPQGAVDRWMRATEYDQPGTEFPNAIVDEIIPDAERLLGVRASRSPDLHFIAGASSGGIAAWNACWYRNDYFRRGYLNSPTFSNIRQGNQLMPLVRKCEARPIRAWVSAGTDEPDYFFGDSYFVAEDAVGALRFAGYDVRYDRFVHGGHGAHWGEGDYTAKAVAWIFEDWRTKPVARPDGPIRVRGIVPGDSVWEPCDFTMPPPVREVRSTDGWRLYSVAPDCRFVMSERVSADGRRDQRCRLAPLELAWDVSQPGGKALALAEDDRVFVATELGVQGVVTFGIADAVLPLPGDLPCDNVTIQGRTLYAASGERVFRRSLRKGAADPSKRTRPSCPGYGDGFRYTREHDPAGGIAELIGSAVMSGRIRGVISIVRGADGAEQVDLVGWSDAAHKVRLTREDVRKFADRVAADGRFLHVEPEPGFENAAAQLRRDWVYEADKLMAKGK